MSHLAPSQDIYRLPKGLRQDLENLRRMTVEFKAGSISADQFKAFRVPQGVYEQREQGTFMLRVRCPAGGVLPHHMRALAAVSAKHGNGVLHVTTRQDIQVHGVPLDNVHPALVELYAAGLSSKGGGGNTVRNITACCDAGVCVEEEFDVSPYAVALTEFLLSDPRSYQLPRKYKIAFSGCPRDCAGATVNDVGCVAKRRGSEFGFAVYVGGGLGAYSRVADLFEAFATADEIHLVAEAIKRVFDKHGNREDRDEARLRFLIDEIDLERFRELYQAELAALRQSAPAKLEPRPLPFRDRPAPEPATATLAGFDEWRGKNVVPQKQDGYHRVQIPLLLGDIASKTLEKLSEIVEQHGEGMVRTTQCQNLVIRWVHENDLPSLHQGLACIDLAQTPAPILSNMTACAGASTCKLGICLSRGLAQAIRNELTSNGLDLDQFGELNIHMSGCSNSCGRHPIADIGLYGAARQVDGHLLPYYILQLGGKVEEGATRLAEGMEAVPARNLPALLAKFLRTYAQSPEYPDFDAFLEAGGREEAAKLAAAHKKVPAFDEDSAYYHDWGADTPFSLADRGPGECAA